MECFLPYQQAKDVRVISVCSHPGSELVSLEGTQERKNNFSLVAIRLQPLTRVSPEEIQDVKTQNPDN